ncbi:MAG: hypothetical protein KJO54_02100 [Gammaproteobacteria bacterium]|nr:hypothetical protein [Gammaproteobacteria bacterium]
MRTGTFLAIALFVLVSLAHAARLVWQLQVTIDDRVVPMWVSAFGVVVPVVVAILLFRELR